MLTADKWREFAATLPPEQRVQARELNHAYGASFLTKDAFFEAIRELTGKLPADNDSLPDGGMSTKNKPLLAYIAELKQSYKIGLLSNVASNWIRDHFLTSQEQKLFDAYILSYEVRMTKPDPRIFHLAAERLGVELGECLLVDDVERYGEAAKQVGMHFVHYQDFVQARAAIEHLLAAEHGPDKL